MTDKDMFERLGKHRRKSLSEAFSKIHGSNWKDAFTCEVPEKDFKLYDDACVYHTGLYYRKFLHQ